MLNFEIGENSLGRLDLKIDSSGYAGCVFSGRDLLFVKMNGNHTISRLEGFIDAESRKMLDAFLVNPEQINNDAFEQLGKKLFQKLVHTTSWLKD